MNVKTLALVLTLLIGSYVTAHAAGYATVYSTGQDASAAAPAPTAQPEAADEAKQAAEIAKQRASYPLAKCVVSDEPIEEAVDVLQDGTLVRLCCKGCKRMLEKKPEAVVAKVHEAVVAAQLASYPLEECAVSGESLGSMGDPLDVVVGTRLVRLCCKGCKKGLEKNAEGVMAKVDAAYVAQQLPSYPLEACAVSGEPLEEPIDMLYGTRLVRLCCKGCKKGFAKNPERVLAKLDAAAGGAK